MRRLAVVGLLTIALVMVTISPVAIAQEEYAQDTGDLELTLTLVLTVSGEGSFEESVVLLSLTADGTTEVIDFDTLEPNAAGAMSGSIALPGELEPGTFTLAATGLNLAISLQNMAPGNLQLTLSVVLAVSGDGFVADSVVLLKLSEDGSVETIDLGTLDTDSKGAFSGSITLPDGLEPGEFTMRATGVTEDGTTRVLSAHVSMPEAVTASTTTTTTEAASTTVATTTQEEPVGGSELTPSVVAALLAGLEAVRGFAGS